MPNKPVIFPFGFTAYYPTAAVDKPKGRTLGDDEVAELYNLFYSRSQGFESWEFKVTVMRSAIRLFGRSFFEWAKQQTNNAYLNEKAIRCVADTVKFIATGERDMFPIQWATILDNNPVEDRSPPSALRKTLKEQLDVLINAGATGYLSRWLAQPGGFEDLLVMLSVFFGPDRNAEDKNFILNPSPKNPQWQRLHKLINS